jgi:hypothetical protein
LFVAGALKDTVTDPLPAVAATFCGAPGASAGVPLPGALAAGPVPAALVAVTLQV